ncbi:MULTISPECIES: zinc-dependent alcohol dehydrogenase family protein [Xanthomonas]|uniref:zinc-dependent alcohol dehydrogenase family protein n=1 Tax=Xanthomonas TaxID=338 RepID=UPI000CEE7F3E|nr:NAD(P)-dependent alcohol dehydrogenase [Xanthomonas arboricola]MBB6575394.1 alcohol dehydrogenase [Xanthomonas arboricola]PPT86739.1 alcohol dehydrogenase [Xanthomonas arboricola]PPU10358.1 alcohol dehydrogenase [Xanthomonas arboricola]
MKAYRLNDFTGTKDLVQVAEAIPRPQRGEVLIGVRAVSLNFRDIAMLRNQYPVPHLKGLIPTSDAAGEVVDVGEDVYRFAVGDRVMSVFHPAWHGGRLPTNVNRQAYGAASNGWLVEYKVVNQEDLVAIPENLSYEEAATLPCAALTAWSALTLGEPIRAGHSVLIQGTGGVSIFGLQLAKSLGATVIATTSSSKKAEHLKQLGADEVINYVTDPKWGSSVRALTGGNGVDRVIEVGGPGTINESLVAVRFGGEISAIGFLNGEDRKIDFFTLFGSGATFRHISVGSREGLEDLLSAVSMSNIRPVIDRVFDFEDARDAFSYVDQGSHFGKVVIRLPHS